jgi:hypothetical protein
VNSIQRARWVRTLQEYAADCVEVGMNDPEAHSTIQFAPSGLVWQVWWEIKKNSLEWTAVHA